jgi:hypothetical protein
LTSFYRDKKVVGVFVRFLRAPLHWDISLSLQEPIFAFVRISLLRRFVKAQWSQAKQHGSNAETSPFNLNSIKKNLKQSEEWCQEGEINTRVLGMRK